MNNSKPREIREEHKKILQTRMKYLFDEITPDEYIDKMMKWSEKSHPLVAVLFLSVPPIITIGLNVCADFYLDTYSRFIHSKIT